MLSISQELTTTMQAQSRISGTRNMIARAHAMEILKRTPEPAQWRPDERITVWLADRMSQSTAA